MILTWVRVNTSQWHVLHSIRVGTYKRWKGKGEGFESVPYEFFLTQDGYRLSTENTQEETTNPKVWEGTGLPKGRFCSNCGAFWRALNDSVEI